MIVTKEIISEAELMKLLIKYKLDRLTK
jgi:hypothetical protein